MGVKGCLRKGCKSIMCDRYSQGYGYICDECFSELVDRKPESIAAFMSSEKLTKEESPLTEDYYDAIFPKG